MGGIARPGHLCQHLLHEVVSHPTMELSDQLPLIASVRMGEHRQHLRDGGASTCHQLLKLGGSCPLMRRTYGRGLRWLLMGLDNAPLCAHASTITLVSRGALPRNAASGLGRRTL